MKSKYIEAILSIASLLLLGGCFELPEFPVTPEISFHSVRFVETDAFGPDTLVLSFNFTDGDGDIGLDADEIYPPYHRFNYIVDSTVEFVYNRDYDLYFVKDTTGNFVQYNREGTAAPYYSISEYGSLVGTYSEGPIDLPAYNCKNYIEVPDVDGNDIGADTQDTILIEPNIFQNNIVLAFYRKRNGQMEDITYLFSADPCQDSFNSRIPIFDENNIGRPLKGVIHYAIQSYGFKSVFLNDSIFIDFYIYDRALHQSNVVRSKGFTLPGLLGIN
ncbi:MAG: hypothetical protein OEY56_14065 [Cyclobacteriaceae bacterium]|nr:hypothetical protein [Cyclobacteriaceae bacterium]